ncbi:cytochrome c type biogenesis protein CcmH [Legionella busanensis]|uniref:Cytochrome c type biogenesis protein CcmH n=1 Tax=Legionella busanensis TaxID=190655 RepID=A0A378JIA4_9GAMM|nr:tetratricopeptide repeat protein [Legionella busanensis]STX50874.1 cytochrome c type biogenesis protein CcmH [Legionella busanensis]
MISWGLISCFITLASFAILLIIYPLGKTLKKGFLPFIICLALIISFAYYRWGAFSAWQQYKQNELAEQRAKTLLDKIKSPEELIAKLKNHLDDTPASARGWFLLGRLYSSQGEWTAAGDAFAKAHHLNPQDEAVTIYYANSLWQLNHQQFNQDIRVLFKQLLQHNPNQPDALAMLALDAYESKKYNEAVNYWQQLLKLASPDSEEASALRKAIAKALAQQAKV